MTRKFLVDANLPLALARQLATTGVDCVHVADLGDMSTPDRTVWAMAAAEARDIISRDGDFAQLVIGSASGPSVVWVRLGNVRKQVLLSQIERDWDKLLGLLNSGERLIEIR
jgi:predicted nuclease of predicted toxin-antitoxin system